MKTKKYLGYVAVLVVGLLIGAGLHAKMTPTSTTQLDSEQQAYVATAEYLNYGDYQTDKIHREIENGDGTKLVITARKNPAMITFVFAEPIAPDFFVGCGGIGGAYEIFMDNPEYDPLNIGVDYAAELTSRIRQEVAGVTEDIYAEGYELKVFVAESHTDRLEDIIDEILEVIDEQDSIQNPAQQDAQDPQGIPDLQDGVQSDPV